jgi:hypothetical protein
MEITMADDEWLMDAEKQWLTSSDSEVMLDICPAGRVQSDLDSLRLDRKLRLFAVACCRQIWHWLTDSRSQAAVYVAERFADGLATTEELEAACNAAYARIDEVVTIRDGQQWVEDSVGKAAEAAFSVAEAAAITAARATMWDARDAFAFGDADNGLDWQQRFDSQRQAAADRQHVELLRELFGNRFRPLTIEQSRLTPDIKALVPACYENRSLPSGELERARLTILADALEEAGGFPPELIDHLRSTAPHVRGCWAIDCLLLGSV